MMSFDEDTFINLVEPNFSPFPLWLAFLSVSVFSKKFCPTPRLADEYVFFFLKIYLITFPFQGDNISEIDSFSCLSYMVKPF